MANNPSGAIGEGKHSQAQTASVTVAVPPAGQPGKEAKNQQAGAITDKQPTHDVVEATQATDKAAPDASGDNSTSVSNEVDTAPTPETMPAKAATPSKPVPELELAEDPTPRPPSKDSSVPPPLPEKDTAVTKPTPTSETSTSPSQTTEPMPTKIEDANKTEEPSTQPTEREAPETENADSSNLDADKEGSKPQSGVDGQNRAVDEGSAMQGGDGKADGITKLTLRTDRVRELSSASIMTASSSTPGTPAEEVASSAVDDEESGTPGQGGTPNRKQRKKQKQREKKKDKNKGEENSPRPPSGKTVHNADDSTIQDRNPPVVVTTPPVHIPNGDGDGDGELVEKPASSEEDAPVIVDKVDSSGEDSGVKVGMPQGEAEKTANGDSSNEEWAWQ